MESAEIAGLSILRGTWEKIKNKKNIFIIIIEDLMQIDRVIDRNCGVG